MVVHGDGFIVAGCGDDFDWLSLKLNEKLAGVGAESQIVTRLRQRGNVVEALCYVQRLWTDVGS